jgi:hypothetical protein
MFARFASVLGITAPVLALSVGAAVAAPATPAPSTGIVAQASPAPTATPNPLHVSGYYRGYDFTRQNASNNPGARFDFDPGAKYNSNGVNQATFNNGVQLHADYTFTDGLYVGAGYFYGNPLDGACVVPANHTTPGAAASGVVSCNHQTPPSTNADDTLPGFTLATLDEAYVGWAHDGYNAKVGNQFLTTPWANMDVSRLKVDAFQGADFSYAPASGWNFDVMDMIGFEGRDASTFSQTTYLTSFPAGGGGLASNIYFPGGHGVTTNGFVMGKIGYISPSSQANSLVADGYLYSVSNIVNIYWGDAQYTLSQSFAKPYVALQGGWESNTGASYIGKIQSSVIGLQLGATPIKGKLGSVLFTAGFDELPWKNDSVVLPAGVKCSNTNYQISASGATLGYFLPLNAPQCFTNKAGATSIYYGGWASPYTDNTATDPFFTTQMTQGTVDRRSAGTSEKLAAKFTSTNKRFVFLISDAWYNYGNALAPENTSEWDVDGTYRFSKVTTGAYRGLMLRYRYGQRMLSNTYFPSASSDAAAYLGGLPLFKYNRAQVEYDF